MFKTLRAKVQQEGASLETADAAAIADAAAQAERHEAALEGALGRRVKERENSDE